MLFRRPLTILFQKQTPVWYVLIRPYYSLFTLDRATAFVSCHWPIVIRNILYLSSVAYSYPSILGYWQNTLITVFRPFVQVPTMKFCFSFLPLLLTATFAAVIRRADSNKCGPKTEVCCTGLSTETPNSGVSCLAVSQGNAPSSGWSFKTRCSWGCTCRPEYALQRLQSRGWSQSILLRCSHRASKFCYPRRTAMFTLSADMW